MTGWAIFDEEVARWRAASREVELWWRDDDAVDDGPELERLLALQRRREAPLALAVVPANATTRLADRIATQGAIDVLQHGYSHDNHASPNEKKMELGLHRPTKLVLGELGTGWLALERLFGERALAVLVPPWNRIAPALIPTLPEIGFAGMSAFGNRVRAEPVQGLREVNTHVDLIDWKGGRGFVGEQAAVDILVKAIGAARQAGGEPVGILSHHLAMDERAWDFLDLLLVRVTMTPGVIMCPARGLFALREARV
jgi:hypothetical protein